MTNTALRYGWNRLVRFKPQNASSKTLVGQPFKTDIDIGRALRNGARDIEVEIFSGSSVLEPGSSTGTSAKIDRICSPLTPTEVGTLRCIGLNYRQHAAETNMELPKVPAMFMKPSTSLGDPWPSPTPLPKITQLDDCGDYESELAVVIGKTAKNIAEADAVSYVLGYTAANDMSSRTAQFAQSQWNYSKGFDGACPLGPVIVSPNLIPDPSKLQVRGLLNGKVVQDCGTDDLIFSIPKLISFLSQGTTLLPGTVILTGTPAGVGFAQKPRVTIRDGDEFHVEILPHIGMLVTVFENER